MLLESGEHLARWLGTPVGIFVDVNSGMKRTGISQEPRADILELARSAGAAFCGLRYYHGHAEGAAASAGYDRLCEIVDALVAGFCSWGSDYFGYSEGSCCVGSCGASGWCFSASDFAGHGGL